MKNIHVKLFFVILVLLGVSAYVVSVYPTREGLDIKGGMRVVLRAKTEELKSGNKWTQENLETVASIIRNRVDGLGVSEPVIYTKPETNQIIIELPGLTNKAQARDAIQTTARLEFRKVPELESEWRHEPDKVNGKETGFEKITGRDGNVITPEELDARVFSKPPVLAGDELEPNSRAELTPQGTVIHFEFKGDAKRVFEEFTRSNINKPLAIFLDKKLVSAPNINDVIPGVGIIEGHFTPDQARTLASQLNAGALPVPLEWMSDNTIEATLGRQAVHQTTIAGIVGLALVLLFMLLWYRLPGLLADIALCLYATFAFAIFKLVPVTLTVPGVAGFILSIGMAVDANVLIFERMKEERLAGKTMRSAIEAGFKHAFTAIFDSNMCTLITCAILYNFGTGQIRGFALTLAIGVLVSMFTAITCTRTFLLLISGTHIGQNDDNFALHRGFHPKLNVCRNMNYWFGVSALLIVPGLIFWLGLHGTKYSIEFRGGTEMSVVFNQRPAISTVSKALANAGFKETRVLLAEGNRAWITTKHMTPDDQIKANAALTAIGGRTESSSAVSGAISKELRNNALSSVFYASICIVIYLAIRFAVGGVAQGLKFGTCAIAATLHDVLVLWGVFAIFGYFIPNWQVDSLFVTAALTVIGFSTHDTIVIFDRIRENLKLRARGETFAHITDHSIEQTFARSINTSLTVVLTLTSLLILGGSATRVFVAALLIGVISGTYSSIFNASPLLVLWRHFTGDRINWAVAGAGAPGSNGKAIAGTVAGSTPRPVASAPTKTATASEPAADDGSAADQAGARAKAKQARRKRRM